MSMEFLKLNSNSLICKLKYANSYIYSGYKVAPGSSESPGSNLQRNLLMHPRCRNPYFGIKISNQFVNRLRSKGAGSLDRAVPESLILLSIE